MMKLLSSEYETSTFPTKRENSLFKRLLVAKAAPTAQKINFSIKDLVTFTEESLNAVSPNKIVLTH